MWVRLSLLFLSSLGIEKLFLDFYNSPPTIEDTKTFWSFIPNVIKWLCIGMGVYTAFIMVKKIRSRKGGKK